MRLRIGANGAASRQRRKSACCLVAPLRSPKRAAGQSSREITVPSREKRVALYKRACQLLRFLAHLDMADFAPQSTCSSDIGGAS